MLLPPILAHLLFFGAIPASSDQGSRLPVPELVGIDAKNLEALLGGNAVHEAGPFVVEACRFRCDATMKFEGTERGLAVLAELRNGRVTRARWRITGDLERPGSFPLFSEALAGGMPAPWTLLGSALEFEELVAPDGWGFGCIGWTRGGRFHGAIVLAPVGTGTLDDVRVFELIETDARVVEDPLPPPATIAGHTSTDLLRVYGAPQQVVGLARGNPVQKCAGSPSCEGLWTFATTCYRSAGLACSMLIAEVSAGVVLSARWDFEMEGRFWRLPSVETLLDESTVQGIVLMRGVEPYELPDGTIELLFRTFAWESAGVEWSIDVGCVAIPDSTGLRRARTGEYRVISVFQRATPGRRSADQSRDKE